MKIHFAECQQVTLGKECFAECLLCGTRQRSLFAECQPLALGKNWRLSALGRPLTALCREPLCRVFDTRQTILCRVPPCAECSALGKGTLCRAPNFTECGTRQSLLCRVPDKRHSAKKTTLGKASDSGSDFCIHPGLLAVCVSSIEVHQKVARAAKHLDS
jgi:hypothetical protein